MSDTTPTPTATSVTANQTLIGVRADMTVGTEDVGIVGFLGEEFHFKLEKPAVIGSAMSIAYWLKDTYKVSGPSMDIVTLPDDAADSTAFAKIPAGTLKAKVQANLAKQQVPGPAIEVLTSALLVKVIVTNLAIDSTPSKTTVVFGLQADFTGAPLKLFGDISLQKASLLIVSAPKDDMIVKNAMAAFALTATGTPAKGQIKFKAIPTKDTKLKLGAAEWTFSDTDPANADALQSKIGADVAATVTALADRLNKSTDKEIVQCEYKAAADTLQIQYRLAGTVGDKFVVLVTPDAEITKMAGGVDA